MEITTEGERIRERYRVCVCAHVRESLMAEWLEQASQGHEMYCHDLEVTSSNPCLVELGVLSISVLSRTRTKHINVGVCEWERVCVSVCVCVRERERERERKREKKKKKKESIKWEKLEKTTKVIQQFPRLIYGIPDPVTPCQRQWLMFKVCSYYMDQSPYPQDMVSRDNKDQYWYMVPTKEEMSYWL